MSISVVTDQRASGGTQGITQARRVIDISDDILLDEPDATPLTILLANLNRDSVYNHKFHVQKDVLQPIANAINYSTGYTAGATTFKVDQDEYFQVGDVIKVTRTGETMRVASKSATDSTITVNERSWGAVAAAALVDNDPIMILSDVNAQGADVKTAISTKVTTDYNYLQIFRTPKSITGTLNVERLYGGPDFPYQMRKAMIEHRRKYELQFWYGERNENTSSGTSIYTTGGVNEHITTNETDVSGNLTYLEIVAWLRSVFRYGESTRRMAFLSREGADAFSLVGLPFVEISPDETTFGLALEGWRSPHGMVNFSVVNLFSDDSNWAEVQFLLDLSQYGFRSLEGRDTHIRTNVQNPGVDGRTDEVFGEVGLDRGIEKSSGRLIGVQLGA